MKLPKVKIRIPRPPKRIPPPSFSPRPDSGEEPESLTGTVQDIKASAPEERLARALEKQDTQYEFRHTVGAPRGMPGWKEVDFVIAAFNQVFAIEVDTAFTHREKGRADVLHDAIVIHELQKEGMTVYPTVIHVDGESDLATHDNAIAWVKQRFPAAASFQSPAVELPAPVQQAQTAQPVQVAAPRQYSQREKNERAARRKRR